MPTIWRVASSRVFMAAMFVLFTVSAFAETVTIKEETPTVTVDVPDTFVSSTTTRGIQAKTPDGEVFVWFETYGPDELDALIKEHDEYWTKSGVEGGDQTDKVSKEISGKSVVATDFKGTTWKGKPTVIRYLYIDANLPSQKRVLMSLWASPSGDEDHDAEVSGMIGSLKIRE